MSDEVLSGEFPAVETGTDREEHDIAIELTMQYLQNLGLDAEPNDEYFITLEEVFNTVALLGEKSAKKFANEISSQSMHPDVIKGRFDKWLKLRDEPGFPDSESAAQALIDMIIKPINYSDLPN